MNEPIPPINIDSMVKTKRQVAKLLLKQSSPVALDTEGNQIPISEESIHIVIYGKVLKDDDGTIIDNEVLYPDCVDHKRAMSDDHPTLKEEYKKLLKELKTAIRTFLIKTKSFMRMIFEATAEIASSVGVIISSMVILPFGSGIPTAVNALLNIIASINKLSDQLLEFLPILGPLMNIFLLIAEQFIITILTVINTTLKVLIVILGSVVAIKKPISELQKGLSKLKGKAEEAEAAEKAKAAESNNNTP